MIVVYSLIKNPLFLSLLILAIVVIAFFGTYFATKFIYLNRINNSEKVLLNDKKETIETYLVKIHAICTNNFEYQNIYDDLSGRFQSLFDSKIEALKKRKASLHKKVKNCKLVNKNLVNSIKTYLKEVEYYKKEVGKLITECEAILKQEDDLRKQAVNIKTMFQELNKAIETYNDNLLIVLPTLNSYISDIEMEFDLFETAMHNANYQDAIIRLSSIENKINKLYGQIPQMANKCNIVTSIIPNKVNELINKNDELLKQNYYIMHLKVKDLATIIFNRLENIQNNYKSLNFDGFEDDIEEIELKINEATLALDEEVASKINFDNHYQEIIQKVKELEQNFLKTKRQYTSVLEYYHLDEEIKNRFDAFQIRATSLSDQKREFESYIFVNARNPYSFMTKKMNDIVNLSNFVEDEIKYFELFFVELKTYVENIHTKISKLSKNIIVCKGYARKNKMNSILVKNETILDEYVLVLESIIEKLYHKPINVSEIKQIFSPLENNIEDLCIEITNEVNDALLATKSILFANQLRDQFQELNKGLDKAEELFYKEDYKNCAILVVDLLKTYHPVAYNSIGDN